MYLSDLASSTTQPSLLPAPKMCSQHLQGWVSSFGSRAAIAARGLVPLRMSNSSSTAFSVVALGIAYPMDSKAHC